MGTEIVRTTLYLLPQLGIGQGPIPTDNGYLRGIAKGVLIQVILERHFLRQRIKRISRIVSSSAKFGLDEGDKGVEGTEVTRGGVSGIEGDVIGIGEGHEDGRDTEGVELTEQEVAVEVDKRKYVFQHFTNIFFHNYELFFKDNELNELHELHKYYFKTTNYYKPQIAQIKQIFYRV
jgi:hypothetical protein